VNATPISYDETQSGGISPAVELDAFTFSGSLADQVLVRMDLTAGTMDPQFRVYRPDGTLLCSGNTYGDFVETLCTLDTNGAHTILVGAWNANATGTNGAHTILVGAWNANATGNYDISIQLQ